MCLGSSRVDVDDVQGGRLYFANNTHTSIQHCV